MSQLDSVKIDLRGIILLEAEGKQNLLDFSEAGLSEINYADYLEEVTHVYSHKHNTINTNRCTYLTHLDERTHKYPNSKNERKLKGTPPNSETEGMS